MYNPFQRPGMGGHAGSYGPPQHHHHDHYEPLRPTQSVPAEKKSKNKYGDYTEKEIEEMMRERFEREEARKHHEIDEAVQQAHRRAESEERKERAREEEIRRKDEDKRRKQAEERKELIDKAMREEDEAKKKKKEERLRILEEARIEEEKEKREAKEAQERAVREWKEEQEKKKEEEKALYERALARRKEEEEKEKEKKKKEQDEYLAKVQHDFAKFGMTPNQVKKMVDYDEEKDAKKDKKKGRRHSSLNGKSGVVKASPVFPKIHRDDIEIETLKHYGLEYERAPDDRNYYIILQELDVEETDVLFEHTKKIRKERKKNKMGDKLLPSLEPKNDPNYAWVRRPSRSRGEHGGRERSHSHVRDKSPMRERFAEKMVRHLG